MNNHDLSLKILKMPIVAKYFDNITGSAKLYSDCLVIPLKSEAHAGYFKKTLATIESYEGIKYAIYDKSPDTTAPDCLLVEFVKSEQ